MERKCHRIASSTEADHECDAPPSPPGSGTPRPIPIPTAAPSPLPIPLPLSIPLHTHHNWTERDDCLSSEGVSSVTHTVSSPPIAGFGSLASGRSCISTLPSSPSPSSPLCRLVSGGKEGSCSSLGPASMCHQSTAPSTSATSISIPLTLSLSLPPRNLNADFQKYGYEHVSVLGQGQFGCSHLVRSCGDGTLWVAKVIDLSEMDRDGVEEALSEAAILQRLDHPHIVKYRDSYINEDDCTLVIVMEYCEGGDLFSDIEKTSRSGSGSSGSGRYSERQILEWCSQLASALDYIHRQNILHCDVKSDNIFLTAQGSLKLGDFGIAREIRQGSASLSPVRCPQGTPHYMSPEMAHRDPLTDKSDCWALGCVLFELCCLTHLHPHQHPQLRRRDVCGPNAMRAMGGLGEEEWDPFSKKAFPSDYSLVLKSIVKRLLQKDSSARLSMEGLLLELRLQGIIPPPLTPTPAASRAASPSPPQQREGVLPHTPTPPTIYRLPSRLKSEVSMGAPTPLVSFADHAADGDVIDNDQIDGCGGGGGDTCCM
ncbi:unnamed protein product [Vitrella brassicaformis CCMP3155]|uniref:non-specific serine/threonine protein kinase n=1 Tax=Vitrella brassicaformis (strain CCMP3155) TaxID=1169540 RepID=A0A0G4GFU1_VITBC|nr:unnamed protein product [Vitrella brassicaformis CCMP3155]|eukprot:CEM28178.1 unnamed protein product [Vitrella brassicaformis CCMP3155]